ncbi:hypothetical protein D3C74_43990 [compost metagenome]
MSDELHLDGMMIDSLIDLLRASFFLEEWDRMIEISDKVLVSSTKLYNEQKNTLDNGGKYIYGNRGRHLIYYFGFGYMSKGIALYKKEKYNESRDCISQYSNLTWLNDGSEDAKEEIYLFKLFAKGNGFTVDLMEGKDVLDNYVAFLKESRPEELLPGLINILEASLKNGNNIDQLLEDFKTNTADVILYYEKQQRKTRYLTNYFYLLSLYRIKMGNYQDAVHNILLATVASDSFKDMIAFKKCVALFDIYRNYATDEQLNMYSSRMLLILKEEFRDEKSYYFNDDRIRVI